MEREEEKEGSIEEDDDQRELEKELIRSRNRERPVAQFTGADTGIYDEYKY